MVAIEIRGFVSFDDGLLGMLTKSFLSSYGTIQVRVGHLRAGIGNTISSCFPLAALE